MQAPPRSSLRAGRSSPSIARSCAFIVACALQACIGAPPPELDREGDAPHAGAAHESDVAAASQALAARKRPNILLIIADDLGYSDIGAFGSEIHTPNLDALASEGRLLTDHHVAPTCSPTRAALYSGTDHHLVGLGTMAEILQPNQVGQPGYEGYLNEHSLSFADLLHDSGYHTYIAGKWHVGLTEDKSPKAWGFESSFILAEGGASHFAPDPARLTSADNATYRENGSQVRVPDDFYSTDFYTDKLLSYLDANRGDGKPFLALATYTSPHWPLQATDAFIDRYKGKYDVGYDVIRKRRIVKQKLLGVVPWDQKPHEPLPSTPDNPRWDDLTPEQKKLEARRQEIYAAMVENLDWNIGRLIGYLKRTRQYDDTFIFFQSDNGAEGGAGVFPDTEANDLRYENFGRRYSNVSYGKRWAEVSATPYRIWKAYTSEGGTIAPAIARLPKQRFARLPFSGFTHVSDLAPTFLELAGVADPGTQYKGREVYPITGKSILPRLQNRAWSVHPQGEVFADELFGRRYVRRDRWKLLYVEPPYGSGDWALYDLWRDPAESTDVSAAHPDIVADLRAEFAAYAERVGLILPANNPGPAL
jgi:arylsulfatase